MGNLEVGTENDPKVNEKIRRKCQSLESLGYTSVIPIDLSDNVPNVLGNLLEKDAARKEYVIVPLNPGEKFYRIYSRNVAK